MQVTINNFCSSTTCFTKMVGSKRNNYPCLEFIHSNPCYCAKYKFRIFRKIEIVKFNFIGMCYFKTLLFTASKHKLPRFLRLKIEIETMQIVVINVLGCVFTLSSYTLLLYFVLKIPLAEEVSRPSSRTFSNIKPFYNQLVLFNRFNFSQLRKRSWKNHCVRNHCVRNK